MVRQKPKLGYAMFFNRYSWNIGNHKVEIDREVIDDCRRVNDDTCLAAACHPHHPVSIVEPCRYGSHAIREVGLP